LSSQTDKIPFTQEPLNALTAQDRRRLEGRLTVAQGFHNGTKKSIVYSPHTQGHSDLRLFGVDFRQVEVASEAGVRPDDPVQLSDQTVIGDKLPQDETDRLFY